ncbi:MAG: phosphoribosylanthranilate isomerase [Clostridia bacterium]|nr:phosphoribosylanthranilate isomerase [Clostridia bacterium]
MTKIKICGLSREYDIDFVNIAKPDFIGFVFAEKSKRKVDFDTALKLKNQLDKNIKSVGVFVNNDMDFILSLVNNGIIDLIQLHGDEDENYILSLKEKTSAKIIRAVRVKTTEDIIKADKLPVDYLLLDTYTKGEYGGSGKKFDWNMIPEISKPYFLAGGLNAENIKKALKVGAYCLDVSSGAETDGKKDKDKIIKIVNTVRSE